jgi:hypothetical protein
LPSISGSFQADYLITLSAVLTETKGAPAARTVKATQVTVVVDLEIRWSAY